MGFAAIQVLGERHRVRIEQRTLSPSDDRPAGVYGDYEDRDHVVRLLMPLTMMNESGEALRGVKISLQDLLIVCDDVNLPLGTLRLRPHGSAGGHHGLESCLEVLGTEQVARLRVGVGITALPQDLHDFVLSPFSSAERPLMQRMVEQAADACEIWVLEGVEVAMNRFNRADDVS